MIKLRQEQKYCDIDEPQQEDTTFMHKLELQRILMELKLKEIKKIEQNKRNLKMMKVKQQNAKTDEMVKPVNKNEEKKQKNYIKYKKWLCCL